MFQDSLPFRDRRFDPRRFASTTRSHREPPNRSTQDSARFFSRRADHKVACIADAIKLLSEDKFAVQESLLGLLSSDLTAPVFQRIVVTPEGALTDHGGNQVGPQCSRWLGACPSCQF